MRRLILAIAMLLMFSFSIASAAFQSASIQEYVDIYNSRIENAPDVLKGLLGDEKVNIEIIRNDGSVTRTGFVVEQARIQDVVDGGLEDPTITVVTTESAIDNVKSSDNPVSTFQEERDAGQVRIEGKSFASRVKLQALLSSGSVIQYFYDIFFGTTGK
jgi:hypothetical protein